MLLVPSERHCSFLLSGLSILVRRLILSRLRLTNDRPTPNSLNQPRYLQTAEERVGLAKTNQAYHTTITWTCSAARDVKGTKDLDTRQPIAGSEEQSPGQDMDHHASHSIMLARRYTAQGGWDSNASHLHSLSTYPIDPSARLGEAGLK